MGGGGHLPGAGRKERRGSTPEVYAGAPQTPMPTTVGGRGLPARARPRMGDTLAGRRGRGAGPVDGGGVCAPAPRNPAAAAPRLGLPVVAQPPSGRGQAGAAPRRRVRGCRGAAAAAAAHTLRPPSRPGPFKLGLYHLAREGAELEKPACEEGSSRSTPPSKLEHHNSDLTSPKVAPGEGHPWTPFHEEAEGSQPKPPSRLTVPTLPSGPGAVAGSGPPSPVSMLPSRPSGARPTHPLEAFLGYNHSEVTSALELL
ncbi:translation initiation factor IF-2-like [Antechinus flavipes]|uniref:translation initiation factor IF-2-like n=1 Tax=Antechinus flavipes TaxID=38775 RepID=UPI002235FB16|nr:translation initiation factor IF-2-like [Antechinus flavipes]